MSATGLALLSGCGSASTPAPPAAAGAPPETTTLRFSQLPASCLAPQFVAEDLLRAEGFTDIRYVSALSGIAPLVAGEADLSMTDPGGVISAIDGGHPVVALAGIHGGCLELFATERVQAIGDLKGKTIAVPQLLGGRHLFVASVVAYVGLDPTRDVNWIALPAPEAMQRLAEGTIDATIGFPPEPQELRARGIGHVLVNTGVDRPWSEHFCCYLVGRREFVQRHPVATKRALRAILKAAELCAAEPERVAGYLMEKGYAQSYEYTLEALREIPFGRWREYDPDNTLRFLSLRLHDTGLIKMTPNALLERGTDWRFFNELKRELKG